MKRSSSRKRRLNLKNCYILFVSMVAILSLVGNVLQDKYYNEALNIQQQTIETFAAEYNEAITSVQTASISLDK